MMKIAIAGTNGFAQFIAFNLSQNTCHNFVFLTRVPNPGLKERGWQVLVVDYQDAPSLAYSLKGIDLVISTIHGETQLALVKAAASVQVRHFIPSAFSGPEQTMSERQPDNDWAQLVTTLNKLSAHSLMNYTLFTCGVFYERFGPGGLNAVQISTANNRHPPVGDEGNFLIDMRSGRATVPVVSDVEEVSICMTSVRDVARYIVATLQAFEDLSAWPREFKFYTEKLAMSQLLEICTRVRGKPIVPAFTTPAALRHAFDEAQSDNQNKALSIAQHIAVAESHPAINFSLTEINLMPDILNFARSSGSEPAPSEPFETWLSRAWSTPSLAPPTTSVRTSANTSGRASGKSSRSASSQKSKRSTPK